MARARNIKPGFFKNELLIELGAFDRLLFVGLWCLADREGRIEDRPKRIKLELFPCDTYDVDAGLDELARCGFIKRYEFNGTKVVYIVNFLKHQTPHGTEKDSELPDENGCLTQHDRVNGYVTGQKRTNNVKSDANNRQSPLDTGAKPVIAPLDNSAKTVIAPLDNALNPESLFTDSLNPDSSVTNVTVGKPTLTPDEIIFGYGVPILTSAGTAEKQARSFLGGLRKAHGDAAVVNTLRECIRAKPLQPLEWLAKAMLPESIGAATETRYQKSKREQMQRDFPNLFLSEAKNGAAALLG